MLGGVVATIYLVYSYRHELIGDISQDKKALYQQLDVEGSKLIKESIKENRDAIFKKT